MSTTTMERPVARMSAEPEPRLRFTGVLRSEWVKLRSVRSSSMTLLGAAFAMLSAGLIFASTRTGGGNGPGPRDLVDPTAISLAGVNIAQLIIGVLGVMVVSSEYSTGMIRSTLTGVPTRLPVLAAKVAVVIGTVFPTMLVIALSAFLGGQAIMGGADLPTAALGDPGVLMAIVGSAAALTGIAVIGVALGSITRSTAGALSTLFGLVFLAPGLGQLLLPTSWRDDVLKFLPSNASGSFTSVVPPADGLGTTAGVLVFAAWVVVPLIVAAVLLRRRDA
ncbi:ABC transporter permease subunit [Umezawaea sp. Da 62-37]|uniref:ABC transporter permease subunit n=1 Tax=Umezawaea sp. Da 62-37 TaxID=3075927 RepID=UPI0028F6D61F|nr:ABC transporter permease subunit [Umezawaea sp. Da 62-37]WNV91645.1 ABC transporter permease [Umezawaea sp. Da 62-37]